MSVVALARRTAAPLGVAAARLRARSGRSLLVVAGIAAATTMLVGVLGGGVVARDRAVQKALAALPASDRTFRVDAFGLPAGQSYGSADRRVRTVLAGLTPEQPLAATFFRQLVIGGGLVQLSGIDGLDGLVRLRSGRLPRGCVPARCEVLQLGAGGRREWRQDGIDLVRVGVAALPDAAVFGSWLEPGRPVRLLAAGATAFDRIPLLDGFYRVESWIAPIAPDRTHVWQISRILDRESRAQAALAAAGAEYALSGPDDALLGARDTGRVAGRRLSLIGGEVGALLLGFALVAAVGLRRGLAAERRRLVQRGATRWQILVGLGAEVGATTLAGAAAGLLGGVVAVAIVARRSGLPAGAVLGHGPGSRSGAVLVVGLWAAATTALALVAASRPDSSPGRRVRVVDALALAAAGAAALGFARGGLDAGTLATGGDATFLLLVPLLVCFAAAVAVARLLGPAMRAAERLTRRGPIPLRLATLALARAPARTSATAAFLVVAVGLALFAAGYGSTLRRGAADEAAFAVPLDFGLTEGSRLVTPLEAARPARYERIAPGVRAYPVVRQTANVAGPGTSVLSPTVLGLPPGAVVGLRWRSDFADLPLSTLVARLAADPPATLRGLPLPPGATLSLEASIRGVPVDLALAAVDASGDPVLLPLRGHGRLVARTPARRLTLVGLEVSLGTAEGASVSHSSGEGNQSAIPRGSVRLGPLRSGSGTLTDWRGWVARGGGALAGPRLSYELTAGQTVLVRRPQSTDGRPLRLIASPDVVAAAGPGGAIVLDFGTGRVPARIVGVARRFPDAGRQGEGFVVADESRLAVALDGSLPGTGRPIELWLAAPAGENDRVAAALARPPFAALEVASRRELERSLAADPLARGVVLTLEAAALAAAVLALLALWLALAGELADERGELLDLEAQGVAPGTLRAAFRVRAAALVALALVAGAALGVLLSQLAVSLVRLSAGGDTPVPPLRLAPSWTLDLLGLAAFALVAALVVEATSRRALRGDTPGRPSWSLE